MDTGGAIDATQGDDTTTGHGPAANDAALIDDGRACLALPALDALIALSLRIGVLLATPALMVCLPCRMPWRFACLLPAHALPGMRKLLPSPPQCSLCWRSLPRYMPTLLPSGGFHPPGISTALRGLLPPSGGFHPLGGPFSFPSSPLLSGFRDHLHFSCPPSSSLLLHTRLSALAPQRRLLPSRICPSPPPPADTRVHPIISSFSSAPAATLPASLGALARYIENPSGLRSRPISTGDVARGVVPMPVFRGRGQ
jgi:hypothetical protein